MTRKPRKARKPQRPPGEWSRVVQVAAAYVASLRIVVTLRHVFYHLVSARLIENTRSEYSNLGSKIADARRAGAFPRLVDKTRAVVRFPTWDSPAAILEACLRQYRRDRTEGQAWQVWLGTEKRGGEAMLTEWFGDLGLPIVPLGGHASVSLVEEVREAVAADGRPAVLLYGGDFDATGMHIGETFHAQAGCFDAFHRVALTPELIEAHRLQFLEGKCDDSRGPGFIARYPEIHARAGFAPGVPVQVEIEALPAPELHRLYREAIDRYWDPDAHARAYAQEREDRAELRAIVEAA